MSSLLILSSTHFMSFKRQGILERSYIPSLDGMIMTARKQFASAYDATIAVYNLNDYARIRTLTGHQWEVCEKSWHIYL